MTLEEVKEHYGSCYKACQALNIERANVTNWIMQGYIPIGIQSRFEIESKGKLKADKTNPSKGKWKKTKENQSDIK